jgi:hypothetical protein
MGLRPLFEVTSGIKMVCTVGIQYNPLRISGSRAAALTSKMLCGHGVPTRDFFVLQPVCCQ